MIATISYYFVILLAIFLKFSLLVDEVQTGHISASVAIKLFVIASVAILATKLKGIYRINRHYLSRIVNLMFIKVFRTISTILLTLFEYHLCKLFHFLFKLKYFFVTLDTASTFFYMDLDQSEDYWMSLENKWSQI